MKLYFILMLIFLAYACASDKNTTIINPVAPENIEATEGGTVVAPIVVNGNVTIRDTSGSKTTEETINTTENSQNTNPLSPLP